MTELEAARVLLVQDGNHGEYRPRRQEIVPSGTPHIRAADISDAGTIDFLGAQRINEVALSRITKGVGRGGDVLLTHKGTVGRVARAPMDAPRFVCSPQTTFWRSLDPNQLDERFLFAYLRSPAFRRQLRARMHESDMAPYVSLTAQRSFSVLLPPIGEQRRIASVMVALDDKIDSNRRLAVLLEDTIAAVFRARFVDFVGVEEFEESEIGPIPRGWEAVPVGRALVVVGGGTPSTKEPVYWEGGQHCWVTPKDLSGHSSPVLLDTSRHITDEGVARISSGILPPETVLLSSRAPVGYTVISKVPVAINQGFIAIPPSEQIPSEFVLFWLRHSMEVIKQNASGTTFAEISKRGFRPIAMVMPPREKVLAFHELARPMFALIASLDRDRIQLTLIRDALLPRLISSEIRVPDTADSGEVIEPAARELRAAS